MSQSSEYARRFNAGEIKTKKEARVLSQSEIYAEKRKAQSGTIEPATPKRKERNTWPTEE